MGCNFHQEVRDKKWLVSTTRVVVEKKWLILETRIDGGSTAASTRIRNNTYIENRNYTISTQIQIYLLALLTVCCGRGVIPEDHEAHRPRRRQASCLAPL